MNERAQFEDVLYRYAEAIDTANYQLLDDVFTADARIDFRGTGGVEGNRAEIKAFLEREMKRFKVLQHFVTNVRVNVAPNGGTASSRAYVLAKHGYPQEGAKGLVFFTLGGEYVDEWQHNGLDWRITHRSLEMRFIEGDIGR